MVLNAKQLAEILKNSKETTKSQEEINEFEETNKALLDAIINNEIKPSSTLKFGIKFKNGKVKKISLKSKTVLDFLVSYYRRNPNQVLKDFLFNSLGDKNKNLPEVKNRFNLAFSSTVSDEEIDQQLEEMIKEESKKPKFGGPPSTIDEITEAVTMMGEDFDADKPPEPENVVLPTDEEIDQLENELRELQKPEKPESKKESKKENKKPKVIPEPRSNIPAIRRSDVNFQGTSVEDRVDQLEFIFDFVDNATEAIPENVRTQSKEGLKIVRSSIKDSKKSTFEKIKSIGKIVLGFVSLAPFVPPQIRAGAGGLLVGIEAIETGIEAGKQIGRLVSGEETETDAIRNTLDNVANVEELAPVAEVGTAVLNLVETVKGKQESKAESEKDKDGSLSTPIENVETENKTNEIKLKIADNIQESGGMISIKEIEDKTGSSIKTPIRINNEIKLPEPEQPEQSEQEKQEGPILSGNQQIEGLYENPIHPDALGIYFGNSSFPKWDKELFKDRERRFENLKSEEISSYLLQQTRSIFSKYSVDLLIPELIYDESSNVKLIEKENMEIVQLWNKLKFPSSSKSSEETVGVKLGDLLKFRGLLTSGAGPSVGDDQPDQTPTDLDEPSPQFKLAQPTTGPTENLEKHPKDTTHNFIYRPSGIRINEVVNYEEARKAHVPSLSEIVTLDGAPQLQTRRNLTRGWSHGGPSVRGNKMNEIRRSILGTVKEEPKKIYTLQQETVVDPRKFSIRTQNKDFCE